MCVIDDVGPKLSEVMPPEPLVRDESLRKTGSVREWDKGKTPVHGSWLPLQLFLSVTSATMNFIFTSFVPFTFFCQKNKLVTVNL